MVQILSISLQNFKTHRDQHIDFALGINAICGENGAGKTSVLEGIAWVLFDHSLYTQDELKRAGASEAIATVTLVSAADHRTYRISRSTNRGYSLYDPQLEQRLEYEKVGDVIPWLRQQLGVAPGTDLARLFTTTIGVPQGTLTADFLKPAGDRRVVFDNVLKVAEYNQIYRELLDLKKYAENQVSETDHQLEVLAVELRDWPDLQQKQLTLEGAIAQDEADLATTRQQVAAVTTTLEHLTAAQNAVNAADQAVQAADQAVVSQTQAVQQAQDALAAAEIAQAEVTKHAEGYQAYLAADQELATLASQWQARQHQQAAREALLLQQQTLTNDLARLEERSRRLEQASQAIARLRPLAQQQQTHEEEAKALAKILEQLQTHQQELSLTQQALTAQTDTCRQTEDALTAAQTAEITCQQHRSGYDTWCRLQTVAETLAQKQQAQQTLQERLQQGQQQLHELEVKKTQIETQQQQAAQITSELAALAPAIARQTQLEQALKIANQALLQCQQLRPQWQQAQQRQHELNQQLSEKEALLQQRQALETQIEQLPQWQQTVQQLDAQLARQAIAQDLHRTLVTLQQTGAHHLQEQQQHSRTVLARLATLQQTYPHLLEPLAPVVTHVQQGLRLPEYLVQELARLVSDFGAQTDRATLTARLQAAQDELQASYKARATWQELAPLPAQIQQLQTQKADLDQAIATLRQQLQAEASHQDQVNRLEADLVALGNPRATHAALLQTQGHYTDLAPRAQALAEQQQKFQAHFDRLSGELHQVQVDIQQLQQQQAEQATHATAYHTYLRHEALAQTLPAAQQAHQRALQQLEGLRHTLNRTQQQIDTLSRNHGTPTAIAQRQADLAAALQDLQDPRQQIRQWEQELTHRPALIQQREAATTAQTELQQQLAQLDAQLAASATLAAQREAAENRRSQHQAAYAQTLTHRPAAATLPTCQTALTEAQQTLERQVAIAQQARQQLAIAQAQWHPEEWTATQTQLRQHQQTETRLETQLQGYQPQLTEVITKLATLTERRQVQQQLEQVRHYRQSLVKFIVAARKVYQKAGPRITELYQQSVNREADRLFREILNRPQVALRWDADYEIYMREGGSPERRFPSLSGGEQMAAALAVRLALLKVLADLDIAFFDEPTTNMDRVRRQRLAEAIANIRSFKQLFVISHDDSFESITENIIRLERLV